MAKQLESYKQYVPELRLSIERNTEDVPSDGMYYVVHKGETLGKFSSLKKAQVRFKEVLAATGYEPKVEPIPKKSAAESDVEHYMESKDLYWAESHKFKERGGKGGRGGV